MRNNLLHISFIVAILLLGACSNEALLTESARNISITATMPEPPTSRVNLVEDGSNIAITWVAGEPLQLVFVQNENKIAQSVRVVSTSNEGKTAHFNITLPSVIEDGSFDLYGVSGGGGINTTGPNPVALLPTDVGDEGSLYSVQERKDVMLYFSSKAVETTNPLATVTFKHLGSLFSITVKDVSQISSSILNQLDEARLVGVGGDGLWAYNSVDRGQSFDLVTGTFLNQEVSANYISFKPAGGPSTVWGWYPILSGEAWPELQLQLTAADNTVLSTSSNIKAPKTPVAGKRYSFYAEWNSANQSLDFTNPF